jgi:hypothetical protein
MHAIRNLFHRVSGGASRFDAYYNGVAKSGGVTPPADGARRAGARHDRTVSRYTWMR